MKKFLSMVLALALVLGMTTAMAAIESVDSNNTASQDVNAKVEVTEANPTYYVNVTWTGTPTFTYKTAQSWNQEALKYEYTEAEWQATHNTVTIENRSNAAVKVDVEYVDDNNSDAFTVKVMNESAAWSEQTLATAVGSTTTGPSVTATLAIETGSDYVPADFAEAKIGSVKVTIAAATN